MRKMKETGGRAFHAAVCVALVSLSAASVRADARPSWPDLAEPARRTGGGSRDAALVVGIENYAFVPGVKGARDNAVAWFDWMVKTRGVPLERVVLLRGADATRERILREAGRTAKMAGKGGALWFVFIGHGAPGPSGRDGLLVGVDAQQRKDSLDARGVSIDKLFSVLQDSRALRINTVIDACFSGRASSGNYLAKGLQPLVVTTVSPAADERFVVLSAAKGDQFAGSLPGLSRPAFSYLVLGALRGWGDRDKDGRVSAGEAMKYAGRALKIFLRDREQEPVLLGNGSIDLAMSTREPGPDLAALVREFSGTSKTSSMFGEGLGKLVEIPGVKTRIAPLPDLPVPDFESIDTGYLDLVANAKGKDLDSGIEASVKARAWQAVARYKGENPYEEQANRRVREWQRVVREQERIAELRRQRMKQVMHAYTQYREDKRKLEKLLRYPEHTVPKARKLAFRQEFEGIYDPWMQEMKPLIDAGEGTVEMIPIAPGVFDMGSPSSESGRDNDEGPVHRVTITRPFLMKMTEVTQGEWRGIMRTNPSYFSECGNGCPVENVNWWEALAFCNALSKREGLDECYSLRDCNGKRPGKGMECASVRFEGLDCEGYRLPTEAEWEYAARAGTTTALYTGDLTIRGDHNGPELDPIAWYGGNSGVRYSGGYDCSGWDEKQYSSDKCGTHPVGRKKPNPWGLYDMLGNVWEWCWDWYDSGYYGSSPLKDPVGPPAGSGRVLRGGSWVSRAGYVRAADRGRSGPGDRNDLLGFRPVRSIR